MKNIEKGILIIFLALIVDVTTFAILTDGLEDNFIYVFGLLIMLPMGAITMLMIHKYKLRMRRRKNKWRKNKY